MKFVSKKGNHKGVEMCLLCHKESRKTGEHRQIFPTPPYTYGVVVYRLYKCNVCGLEYETKEVINRIISNIKGNEESEESMIWTHIREARNTIKIAKKYVIKNKINTPSWLTEKG